MKNLLILLVLFLSTASVVFSQVPPAGFNPAAANMAKVGKVKGKIIDAETKAPMEYANVAIYRKQDSKLVTGGISTATGAFEISELPFGVYYVEANFIGFVKARIEDVKIIPNSTSVDMGTIELAVDRTKVAEVQVVAERNRVEYKIDKKVVNVTNDINAAGGTAITVLENTPSVEVDIDGNVSLRGSSNFTVLIDGRPSVLSGSDALKQIPSSAIQNIEIITNPSVKYDPDGMAGIINVVMKKNVLYGRTGIIKPKLGTGLTMGHALTLKYKSNITSVTLSGKFGNFNFGGGGGGNLHKYQSPATTDLYSVQANNSTRSGDYVSATASFLTKFNDMGTHKLEGNFNYRNRDGLSDETIDEFISDASYQQTNNYLSRVITNEDSKSDDYRLKLDYTLPLKDGAKFEAGLQSRMESETEFFYFKNFDPRTAAFIDNPKFTSDMDFRENIHAIYSTYSGNVKAIQYMFGLRGEDTNCSIDHSKAAQPYKLDRFDIFPSGHLSYELADTSLFMTVTVASSDLGIGDLPHTPVYTSSV